MFYSQVILARKGPLGKIWLAAHFDKKLTKNQIFTTDISESVDSVLNPAAPLALRVSGHLMLGIVRIYSRKVRYLMADCTEAMWKIKLAFRPGNVDLADTQSAVAIDDPRFFGNIVPDQDYPELEDIGFSQNVISNFASLRAARGRTLASQQDTTQQDDFEFRNLGDMQSRQGSRLQSPLSRQPSEQGSAIVDVGHIPGEDSFSRDFHDSGKGGRLSEIEIRRGEQSRGSMSTLARASLSSSGAGMAMRFDDDIPAFDDQIDDMAFGNDEAPPLGYYEDMDMGGGMEMGMDMNAGDMGMDMNAGEEYIPAEESRIDELENINPNRHEEAEEDVIEKPQKKSKPQQTKAAAARGKRQRVTLDESVELSSRVIKQRMADMGPTLRRRPGDYLPKLKPSNELAVDTLRYPPTARGLCPELLSLFAMTMSSRLPFPLLSDGSSSALARDGRDSISIDVVRDNSQLGMSDLKSRRASTSLIEGEDPEAIEGGFGNQDKRLSGVEPMDFGDEGLGFDAGYDPGYDQTGYEPDAYFGEDAPQEGAPFGFDNIDEEGMIPGAGLDGSPGGEPGAFSSWKEKDKDAASESSGSKSGDWSARTAMVHDVLRDQLKENNSVSFSSISRGITRRTAAACFLEILQLKTWGIIDVAQVKPFSDIHISATDKLWSEQQTVQQQT